MFAPAKTQALRASSIPEGPHNITSQRGVVLLRSLRDMDVTSAQAIHALERLDLAVNGTGPWEPKPIGQELEKWIRQMEAQICTFGGDKAVREALLALKHGQALRPLHRLMADIGL